jgi:hypothetical protein
VISVFASRRVVCCDGRDSLGGTARTFMVVHCKPTAPHYRQSIISLTYAARAKLIMNAVVRNEDKTEDSELVVRHRLHQHCVLH